jgi:hypothetical protein
MPDDITSDRETFKALADAIGAYLEAVGWKALVVGHPRIQQQPGERAMNYEFVVRFTGGRKHAAAPEE